MASTAPTAAHPYTYQRASTIATRALVTGTTPSSIPSASSNDVDSHVKPVMQNDSTNHYERAAAEATRADQLPATSAGSVAASVASGPGMQPQGWKLSDAKAQQQGAMLEMVGSGHGFSTTGQ